jgi:hypothetical protein
MTFDVAAFLKSPPVRIEPLSVADLVWQLECSLRTHSRGILVNLARTEHLPFSVAEAVRRMSRCEVWEWRHVMGFDRRYKTRCNYPLCPACTGRLARKEAERVWKLFNAVADTPILFDDLTWLTVNIGYLPIGSSFKAMAAQAKKSIRNMRDRKFPSTFWAMELEIELQADGQGKLHAHGLVWHPGVTRESIEKALRALFTDARAVCAKELRSKRIRREAKGVATYKADISLTVKGWGERTPAILVALIASYESVRTRGRCGLRFEIGLYRRKAKGRMSTVQMDSIKELLLPSEGPLNGPSGLPPSANADDERRDNVDAGVSLVHGDGDSHAAPPRDYPAHAHADDGHHGCGETTAMADQLSPLQIAATKVALEW